MNKNLSSLFDVVSKQERTIIGLMSGTSMDGLDVALCKIKGFGAATKIQLEAFETVPYSSELKKNIKSIFSRHDADLENVCLMHAHIGLVHAQMINHCLQKWNVHTSEVDVIASHGQTIYHAPKNLHGNQQFGNATLQIGDADHIAVNTGIITIADFRQKHIAAGGEGAPLAVYGDYLIFSSEQENRIMLNIGGIANFTYLPQTQNVNEVFSTDVGPGNTLMDAFVQANFAGKYFDENAAIAKLGTIHEGLLEALCNNDFFEKPFPKTTGPELFNLNYLEMAQAITNTQHLSKTDVMATLNKFSAVTIVQALRQAVKLLHNKSFTVYSSGGGMHNPMLMQHLQNAFPDIDFKTTTNAGINPDAKEAVLFAVLANECLAGEGLKTTNELAGIPSVTMGKISLPW